MLVTGSFYLLKMALHSIRRFQLLKVYLRSYVFALNANYKYVDLLRYFIVQHVHVTERRYAFLEEQRLTRSQRSVQIMKKCDENCNSCTCSRRHVTMYACGGAFACVLAKGKVGSILN